MNLTKQTFHSALDCRFIALLIFTMLLSASSIIYDYYLSGSVDNIYSKFFIWIYIIAKILSFGFIAFGVYKLIKFQFKSSFYVMLSGLIIYTSPYVSAYLRNDAFVYPNFVHDQINLIYKQRRSEFLNEDRVRQRAVVRGEMVLSPLLIPIVPPQCSPPTGCSCWIVWDPAHISEVERDIGGWHKPQAAVLGPNSQPTHFAIAHIRRLDEDAYSALGCWADWTAWKPM